MSVGDIAEIRSEFRVSSENLPNIDSMLWQHLNQIPPDRVATYGDIATSLGDRVASRWVGHRLLNHDYTDGCNCHRVVRAGGELGKYAHGSPEDKASALIKDGISVDPNFRIPQFHDVRFSSFESSCPLIHLRELQNRIVKAHAPQPRTVDPRLVAGVDVSFAKNIAVAACSVFDFQTKARLETFTIRRAVTFPYITSYLSFRELPALFDVIGIAEQAGFHVDVLLVDGSGNLHPRGAGIATLLGIIMDRSTIGVTKKILTGTFDRHSLSHECPVAIVDEQHNRRGLAMLPTPTSKPIFVSPGFKIDVPSAGEIVRQVLCGRKLPEPIYWADRLSRTEARKLLTTGVDLHS